MRLGDQKARTELQRAISASRGTFATVGVFSFFINVLMLTVPLYMLQIYDRVLTSRSEDTLLMLTIVAAGLLVTLGLLDLVRSRVLVRVGARLDGQLNRPLLTAMLAERVRGHTASHGQPLRDLETLRSFLTGAGLLSFFDAPWTPVLIAIIFVFHPVLGCIAMGGAIVLFLLAMFNEFVTRGPLTEASEVAVDAHGFAESSLRNAEVIQAMGMMPGLLRRWLDRHESGLALQGRASDRAGEVKATARSVRQFLQIAMLGAGAYLAIRQIITPGVMIVASIIMARALAPVEAAITSWRGFIAARSSYRRLQRLMAEVGQAVVTMELPAPTGAFAVEGLVAAPPGIQKPILKGISFAVPAGETLGIIGPSAAGKSTLARLLVGVWKPMAGHVRLDSADVSQWDHDALGPHIGYLPQDVELFDGTASENIARFNEPDPEQVVIAAKRAGAHDMILRLPDGYDTLIGEAGNMLSGGQKQRVALARALYGDPAVVVLDEPNSNLDAEGEAALQAAVADLKAHGKTVVVIAHRPSIVSRADKLLVLRDGRVEMLGAPDEILSRVTHAVASKGSDTSGSGKSSPHQQRTVI